MPENVTLDQLIDNVASQETVIDSLAALLTGKNNIITQLKNQVAQLLSGETIAPAVQAKIDKAFTEAEENSAKLLKAVTDNTDMEGETPSDSGSTDTEA